LCAQAEQLARAADADEQEIRRALRELQDQWKQAAGAAGADARELDARFGKGRAAVEAMLSGRARAREAALWQTLAEKERVCEELDQLLLAGGAAAGAEDAQALRAPQERWAALPPLPPAWENRLLARRDAAQSALSAADADGKYRARMEQGAAARRQALLELELQLGLDSPPGFQQQRLALQVKQLKERFSNAASAGAVSAGERLLAWCAQAGVADALDRQRFERILAQVEKLH
jgi:hypothetical protein